MERFGINERRAGFWLSRFLTVALGLILALPIAAVGASHIDTFASDPGVGGGAASFTTGTASTGLSYSISGGDDGTFSYATAGGDGDSATIDILSTLFTGATEKVTIVSRDGHAFVFNSVWADVRGDGWTIKGIGPEPFTINVSTESSGTKSPAGGAKLVTSIEITTSDFNFDFLDTVSVELDDPGAAVYGSSNLIVNGDSSPSSTDDTDLGATATGTPVTSTFTISSIGDAALDLTGSPYVTISGSVDFTITSQPTTDPIASGGSDTFTVQCNPTAAGARTAVVSITNNSEASPYTFTVQCTGEADTTKPDVTINQAGGQSDPTNGSPINFTVVFNEVVTGFATGDVTLGGTAGATTGTVTGSGTTYNVAVSGMTGDGTVTATIAAGVAQDGSSNTNNASTSTDNTVTYDTIDPTDPTPTSSSHTVSVWDNDDTVDIAISGASDTGSGVDGFEVEWDQSASWTPTETKEQEESWSGATLTATSDGNWYFHIATVDNAGNWTSTQHLGPFQIDTTPPSVPAGLDPANASYTTDTSPTLSWDASTDTGGSGIRTTSAYRVIVTGTPSKDYYANGTSYTPTLAEGTFTWKVYARDNAGNASAYSTTYTLYIDATKPDVSIDQAGGQADPTTASPVLFTAVFDEPIDDATFTDADITIGGTATTGAVTVTEIAPNDDTTFSVSVVMTGDGTVIADIGAGVVEDFAGNTNTASTSTDNTVSYDGNKPNVTIDQAGSQSDPTNASPVVFTVEFDEPIDDATFINADVTVSGTATTGVVTVTEIAPNDDTTFSVSIVVTADGTVIPTIPAGGVEDVVGNTNNASTSTDNTVTVDTDQPAVSGVTPNAATDADVGILSVSITFDEPMDTGTNPSPTISGLATAYTITGSAWSNGDQTWTGTFTLVDDDEVATGDYNISGFKDVAGNTMVANSSKSIEVDTDNPWADVTVDDLLITDADTGGVFTVIVAFSEGMTNNGTADPTLVFSPDVVGGGTPTLANVSGGWGGSDQFYTVTFDILDNNADADSITIDVTGAKDANGNPQQNYVPVHEFEVDTLNPTVSGVAVTDAFIESVDVGSLFTVTVTFSEDMPSDGSSDPVLVFAPAVATTLSEVSESWTSPSNHETVYAIADGNVIEVGVDVNVSGGIDLHGNAQNAAFDALDRFDIDTLTPTPVDRPEIIVTPMGIPGHGSYLDRRLPLEEGEEPPMIGLYALTAIYEIGELISGGCDICDLEGDTLRGSFVHMFIYTVDPEARPEDVTLVDHWTIHYETSYGGYGMSWDTAGQLPGYYDIRFYFPDGSAHNCRIQLIEPAEE